MILLILEHYTDHYCEDKPHWVRCITFLYIVEYNLLILKKYFCPIKSIGLWYSILISFSGFGIRIS